MRSKKKSAVRYVFPAPAADFLLLLFIFFVDHKESFEQKVLIQNDFFLTMRNDLFCKTALLRSRLFFSPSSSSTRSMNPVDGCCVCCRARRFSCIRWYCARHMLRGIDADPAELGCSGCQCIQGYSDTRKNHSANVLLFTVDNRNCSGGSPYRSQ